MTNINEQILIMTRCSNLGFGKTNSLHENLFVGEVEEKVFDLLERDSGHSINTNCCMGIEKFIGLISNVYKKNTHRIDIRYESETYVELINSSLTAFNINHVVTHIKDIKNASMKLGDVGVWVSDTYIQYPHHLTVVFNTGLKNVPTLTLKVNLV